VWATGVCPRRSRNEFTFGSINETIIIGEAKISPGDMIIADESGVVCVPKEISEKILNMLQSISHQEAILEDQVLRGEVQNWDEL
jgi:regulator of RNase E activity RraA